MKGLSSLDQFLYNQAVQLTERPVYCRYCGQNLKTPTKASSKQESGGYLDPWEIENEAHATCYRQTRQHARRLMY